MYRTSHFTLDINRALQLQACLAKAGVLGVHKCTRYMYMLFIRYLAYLLRGYITMYSGYSLTHYGENIQSIFLYFRIFDIFSKYMKNKICILENDIFPIINIGLICYQMTNVIFFTIIKKKCNEFFLLFFIFFFFFSNFFTLLYLASWYYCYFFFIIFYILNLL